ncbi:HU family DNA-binding protein [Massilibacteroides sp.]|uniref:HU family DNA-binding protein n=1 Tax=Massilibacteroides sp. TaxID=2034766 RepID=UPI0026028AE2|nr:HU family DNA-binding protein [Massilibacteroides sp.]MDD4515135.1 HU family DNA-binding protein [Massilibacteroides sp.]
MNERLNISDLATLLAEYTGKDKKTTELFVRELISVISDALLEERIVKVKGLGTFKIIQVDERESVHVNTGERFVIPAHSKFTFTPDKELKEQVNKPFASFETTELNDGVTFSEIKSEDAEDSEEEIEEVKEVVNEEEKELPQQSSEEPEEIAAPIVALQKEKLSKETHHSRRSHNSRKHHERSKRSGTAIFISLFVLVCLGGGIYLYYMNRTPAYLEEKAIVIDARKQTVTPEPEILPDSVEEKALSEEDQPESLSEEAVLPKVNESQTKEIIKVKIVPDTRLTLIAQKYYGHKVFWVYIYEYNKAIIQNPNNIQIGTELIIPDASLYNIDAKNPESIKKAKALQSELNSKF